MKELYLISLLVVGFKLNAHTNERCKIILDKFCCFTLIVVISVLRSNCMIGMFSNVTFHNFSESCLWNVFIYMYYTLLLQCYLA